ncbi:molybdenum cofactor guanylyltransferase [Falsibacillus albus]|uniref:Probable molybdenum cofactor guanylyltransferase n=1 Tax=Falsibacillus albus TaxID=2478915 RepID=A0A3L7JRY8_9BACI|nr:molybdenum cofactor guanylyltransferase [Falsibacillus albus]RLQ93446.1 molybdenum cofactor guanylyltransferase [Falsibacillus albus]
MKLSMVITAGGQSSRMGSRKDQLSFRGKCLLDLLIDRFKSISSELIIVANEPVVMFEPMIKVIEDVECFKGKGPLAGLYSGMTEAVNDYIGLIACDMPFASAELVQFMAAKMEEEQLDAVVPSFQNRLHPLLAVYHRRIAEKIEQLLKEDQRSIKALLAEIHYKKISPDELPDSISREIASILFNMNTPEDYHMAKMMMQKKGDEHELCDHDGTNQH